MALIVTFLGLFAVVAFAPDTPAARFLHRALIALPARALAHISRGHLSIAVALVAGLASVFWLIDEELALVMTMMAPEALAYLAMFEIGTLVDAIVTTMLVATSVRFPRIAAILSRLRPRARTSRARRPQRPLSSNNDDGASHFAIAA
ncbi:MAG: hypothetical protein EOP62_17015 [Sphingomonadales bacterium]|nr:MAG: hypothetical protein EOP62_17015 [Sphingomonadales bacterium]